MNKKKSILVSVALAASMLATSMSAFAYTDISADHWAKSFIDNLSGKKYISGYEDGTYKPDNNVTRAEFAKILTNIFGVIDKNGVALADVADTAWYADTMKIAVKAGYITGYSDGTVKPEDFITRQEAAVMVYRAWGLSPEGALTFTDKASIADWASNQVATLAAKNVINGYSDGSFQPNNYITRAEVAKIISLALGLGTNNTTASTTTPQVGPGGVTHLGGTTSSVSSYPSSSSSSSSSSSGGSSSSSSGGSSSSSKPTTVAPNADIEVQKDILKVADKYAKDPEDEVIVQFNTSKKAAQNLYVSFTRNGERQTMTIEEFNNNEFVFTKEELDSANIVIENPDGYEASNIDVTADVYVNKSVSGKPSGTTTTKPVSTTGSVNYVIDSLKNVQTGAFADVDIAVIAVNATKNGSDDSKCDKWLTDNEVKLPIYNLIATTLVNNTTLGSVSVTDSTYKTYKGYFDTMFDVVEDAAVYAASKNGELTRQEALDYFNDTVTAAVKKKVDNDYEDEVVAVAKQIGLALADKLDEVNAAVAAASTQAEKVAAVYEAYNAVK